MIGNDIVDLKQAKKDCNWQRQRYLNKIFTEAEQQYIFNSKDQHLTVWSLWSMKEAAYKIFVQQNSKHFFNPKKVICEPLTKGRGLVSIGDDVYYTSTTISKNYVFTIAKLDINQHVISQCFQIQKSNYRLQSLMVKQRFLEVFSKHTKPLSISKDRYGIPRLFQDNKSLNQSFSLTHHGFFCGYSY